MVRTKTTVPKRITEDEQKDGQEHNELGVIPPEEGPEEPEIERKPAKLRKVARKKKAATVEEDGVKKRKKRRSKPGVKALREIREYQKSTKLLIPKAPFSRLVREVAQDVRGSGETRFSYNAMLALHEAAEEHVARTFRDGMNLACASKKKTLFLDHMRLARRIIASGFSSSYMDPELHTQAENDIAKPQ